jgi:hydroxymethylpyrimidine/phosphomethylpyrimidine kinase
LTNSSKLKPVALTIAGSDCSAGAGIQADLKTFSALDVYGLTAVTSVVAEVPGDVAAIQQLPAKLVGEQIRILLRNFPVAAIKTGLLGSAEVIREVAAALESTTIPVVIDPVSIASTGDRLAEDGFENELRKFIESRANLVTPNRAEAQQLLSRPIEDARGSAIELSANLGCAVLLKGGHFEGSESIDWLAQNQNAVPISGLRIEGLDVHGTGCTYSAAIAAQLALGREMVEAVRLARAYLHSTLANHLHWPALSGGKDVKALAHFAKPGQVLS